MALFFAGSSYNRPVQITVNGQPQTLADGLSVRQLVESLNLGTQACAVEVNKTLVPRKRHEEHRLEDGDRVEIVTLVGGG